MNAPTGRIGFCCKWVSPHGDKDRERLLNQRTTTIAALSRLSLTERTAKLMALVQDNMASLLALVSEVATLPPHLRMLRITSELLPAYTHDIATDVYAQPDMRRIIEDGLARIGAVAQQSGVRLTMHPGQFCVLNSRPDVVTNAVREIEYHTEVMVLMGYTGWHRDGAVVNIHGGGRAGGLDGFRTGFSLLSENARNLLTVENDEVSFGLDDLLPIIDTLPIVVDFHHHWIASRGEYLQPDDPRIEPVIASWRGVRPLTHISVSGEELLADADPHELPDFARIVGEGIATPKDLRAHSEGMWNHAVNRWAAGHLSWADIEVEAKGKNIAARQLADSLGHGGHA